MPSPNLFTQSRYLAQKLDMVKMGRVAVDGTKLAANASNHKAMSYGRLVDKEERVEAEIAALEAKAHALLADAEATDTAEDQTFGPDGKDVDLPAELDRREKRLARMQAARAQIEAEAADKARRHAEEKERRRQERAGTSDEQAVTDAGQQAAAKARPKPKAQATFTDLDSRIMKNSDGAYIQAYNAQAVVDEKHQVITAADVMTNPSDALNYTTMLDQSAWYTGRHPKQALVDAGCCSEANLNAARDRQLVCGTNTFMATGRLAHDEQVPPAPRGRIPANATVKERMARKLRTKPGMAAYSRRKAIVEPVFGQIMTCQNGRQLLLRGEDGARGEWRLLPPATISARSSDTQEPPDSPPWSADQRCRPVTVRPGRIPDGQNPHPGLTAPRDAVRNGVTRLGRPPSVPSATSSSGRSGAF